MLTLDVTPAEVDAAIDQATERGQLAAALSLGRVRATVVSAKTGNHISVHLTCKAKDDRGGWQVVPFRECSRVYVDQPLGGDHGKAPIGTLYPLSNQGGKWAGKFFHATNVDAARVWAARFVIEAAAGRPVAFDQAELLIGNHCLLCGRELDQQDSIRRAIGPECNKKIEMAVAHETGGTSHTRGEAFADDVDLEADTPEQRRMTREEIAEEITGDFLEIERIHREQDEVPTEAAPQVPTDLILLTTDQSASDLLAEHT